MNAKENILALIKAGSGAYSIERAIAEMTDNEFADVLKNQIAHDYLLLPSPMTDYLKQEIVEKTVKVSPEILLDLLHPAYFDKIFYLRAEAYKTIPVNIQEKIIQKIQTTLEKPGNHMHEIKINIEGDSFISVVESKVAVRILTGLVDSCDVSIAFEFLKVLELLSLEDFTKTLENPRLVNIENKSFSCDENIKFLESLPKDYRAVFLKILASGKVSDVGELWESAAITSDFLNSNAKEILAQCSGYDFEQIAKVPGRFNKNKHSEFLLQGCIDILENDKKQGRYRGRRFVMDTYCEYLSVDDFATYCERINVSEKRNTFLAALLRSKNIVRHPATFKKALRAYCDITAFVHIKDVLDIPDEILKDAVKTEKCALQLIKKEVTKDGSFRKIRFNPEIIAALLSPMAISDPVRYRDEIADTLEAARGKYGRGETIVEKICKFFGSEPGDIHNAGPLLLEELATTISNLPSPKLRTKGFLFVFDLVHTDSSVELEIRYKSFLQELSAIHPVT